MFSQGLVPLESITYVTLQNDCNPVVGLPRCVPHSLKDCLQKAIEAIVRSGVLVKVDQPTDWVHNLVVLEKTMELFVFVLIQETSMRSLKLMRTLYNSYLQYKRLLASVLVKRCSQHSI